MVGFGFGQLIELEPLVLVSTEIDLFPQTHHDPLVEDECSKDFTFLYGVNMVLIWSLYGV